MTMRTTTIRIPFTTRLTNIATANTLAGATRHDFAAVTVQMPWTTRTIKYAEVQIGERDVFTTVTDIDAVRVGVKINAVAFGDTDYTVTPANTGDHTRFEIRRNATAYMATNDPGTGTFTLQIGTATQTGAASNIVGITGVVILTVEYDDTTGSGVAVKTVGFPVQSHHTLHSTSYVEVGTVTGTTNAPPSQIQQLTGSGDPVLPESSITVDFNWLDIYGIELSTTNRTFTYRADGATDNARFTCDQTLVTTVDYFDRWDLKTAGAAGAAIDTTAAHAFEVKVDQANKGESFGGIHWVTYRYDPTSTTHLVSLLTPLGNGGSQQISISDSTATDADRLQILIDIQEPSAIVMRQSGVVLHSLMNAVTRNVLTAGQTARAYTVASDVTRTSGVTLVHRGDHSLSTWGLSRGLNRLTLDVYAATESINTLHTGGYGIVNYHCGLSPSGAGAHNATRVWGVTDYVEVAAATRTNISPTAPAIPESLYALQCVVSDEVVWVGLMAYATLSAERGAGEGAGGGWQAIAAAYNANSAAELGAKRIGQDITDWWRRSHYFADPGAPGGWNGVADPERLDIEASRSWQIWSGIATYQGQVSLLVTYHTNTFSLHGAYGIDGAPVEEIDTVNVFAVDEVLGTGHLVGRDVDTDGTGEFTMLVTDDTSRYFVVFNDPTFHPAVSIGHLGVGSQTPSVRSRGVAVSGIGDVTPAWPNHRKHDIAILICESNTSETVALSAAQGFVQIADSPQNATGSRLTVFWCRATSDAMASPTVTDPGDHVVAQILVIKGCTRTGNPWDVTAGDTAATSTSVTVPGDTTTVDNALVLAITTSGEDSATPQSSAWANANLAGFREYVATQVIDGGGGGFYVAAGVKKTAGAYGNSTATLANTSTQGRVSIALKPFEDLSYNDIFDTNVVTTGGSGYSKAQVIN